jgi:hypothetical protein
MMINIDEITFTFHWIGSGKSSPETMVGFYHSRWGFPVPIFPTQPTQ